MVCQFIESLEYGGAEALVYRLAAGMRDSSYRPVVCCLRRGPLADRLEADGIRVHCLDLRRRSVLDGPAFLVFAVRLLRGLRAVLQSERADIVHAHLPDSIIWAAIAGRLTDTPVLGTYHGLGILPTGRGRFDPRNRVRRVLYRLLSRLTDRTIAVSAPVRDVLCREVGMDPRKTVLMLNGVDTEACATPADGDRVRQELDLAGRRVVTCVGRLIPGKGQRFLVDAIVVAARRFPDATLVLVGDGPERSALEAHARALGVADRVRVLGERSDIPAILAASDVFVLPSFSEGIPLSLVEAMAAAKPVVATAVPGNLDVVVDGRYGLLVPPGNAEALADALCDLLADPCAARALGVRGQGRARAAFDIKRSLTGTIALYDEVLAERTARLRGERR